MTSSHLEGAWHGGGSPILPDDPLLDRAVMENAFRWLSDRVDRRGVAGISTSSAAEDAQSAAHDSKSVVCRPASGTSVD